jgi:Uma2 family endonuclease
MALAKIAIIGEVISTLDGNVTMLQQRGITDEELMQVSRENPLLRFERNADGSLLTMSPTGGISSNREAKAITRLWVWVEDHDLGDVFSSSCGFKLPNGAIRSPDAAFVAKGRLVPNWDQLEDEYINLAPDFVIEIRSKTDSLSALQEKMREYIEQGVRLGWLLDRKNRCAYAYRADGSVTQYPDTAMLSGEEVVTGLTILLSLLL